MSIETYAVGTFTAVAKNLEIIKKLLYIMNKYNGYEVRFPTYLEVNERYYGDDIVLDKYEVPEKYLTTLNKDDIVKVQDAELFEHMKAVFSEDITTVIRFECDFTATGRNSYYINVKNVKQWLQGCIDKTNSKEDIEIWNSIKDEDIILVYQFTDYELYSRVFEDDLVYINLKDGSILSENMEKIPFTRERLIAYDFECSDSIFDKTDESFEDFFDSYFNYISNLSCLSELSNFEEVKEQLKKYMLEVIEDDRIYDFVEFSDILENIFEQKKEELQFIPEKVKRRFEIEECDIIETDIEVNSDAEGMVKEAYEMEHRYYSKDHKPEFNISNYNIKNLKITLTSKETDTIHMDVTSVFRKKENVAEPYRVKNITNALTINGEDVKDNLGPIYNAHLNYVMYVKENDPIVKNLKNDYFTIMLRSFYVKKKNKK